MDKLYEELVLTKEDFGDDLYKVLGEVLNILFKSKYEAIVREEDDGIIAIHYNYDDAICHFGGPVAKWVSETYLEENK